MRAEMEDVKRLVLSRPTECECATVTPTEDSTVDPSTQQLISALVCERAMLFASGYTIRGPILSVFPALIVHSGLKSVHPGFPVAFIF